MNLKIGTKFKIKYKDSIYDTYVNAEIIGIFYMGYSYDTSLKRGKLLLSQDKYYQILVQKPHMEEIIKISSKTFLDEIQNDKKFINSEKKYLFESE